MSNGCDVPTICCGTVEALLDCHESSLHKVRHWNVFHSYKWLAADRMHWQDSWRRAVWPKSYLSCRRAVWPKCYLSCISMPHFAEFAVHLDCLAACACSGRGRHGKAFKTCRLYSVTSVSHRPAVEGIEFQLSDMSCKTYFVIALKDTWTRLIWKGARQGKKTLHTNLVHIELVPCRPLAMSSCIVCSKHSGKYSDHCVAAVKGLQLDWGRRIVMLNILSCADLSRLTSLEIYNYVWPMSFATPFLALLTRLKRFSLSDMDYLTIPEELIAHDVVSFHLAITSRWLIAS